MEKQVFTKYEEARISEVYNCDISTCNGVIADYLSKNKIKQPTIDDKSVCHFLEEGNVLTEPHGTNIAIIAHGKESLINKIEELVGEQK